MNFGVRKAITGAVLLGSVFSLRKLFTQAASAGQRILGLIDHPNIPIDVFSKKGIRADEETFRPSDAIVSKDSVWHILQEPWRAAIIWFVPEHLILQTRDISLGQSLIRI